MTMFRPAKRVDTPLIIGIAGPTKSGKTCSAHRLARGLSGNKPYVMINAEGARGQQYADQFTYDTVDITAPYRPETYTKPILELIENPDRYGAAILDSMSHMHDGPGGMLEWHDEIQDRMARRNTDTEREYQKKLERVTWAAWIEPKKAENHFIYRVLELRIPVIFCFRAKEKLKIVPGKDPIDLGWQPIASERVSFETLFTLVLPPHSKGVPSAEYSEMRSPFDTMVPFDKPIDEELGERLRAWSRGAALPKAAPPGAAGTAAPEEKYPRYAADDPEGDKPLTDDECLTLIARCDENGLDSEELKRKLGVPRLAVLPRRRWGTAMTGIDKAIAAARAAAQEQ